MTEPIKFSDFFQKRSIDKSYKKVIEIPIETIRPNPNQPRKYFNTESINELVMSIKEFGVMQPITVRIINNLNYELVCGERRLRASKIAGLETIPAIVINVNDNKCALLSITENLQRQNLNFIEEALGYKSLVDEYGFTHEEISRKIGKSQSTISAKLRILRLNEHIRQLIVENNLSEGHAKAIIRVHDDSIREEVINTIVKEELTVKKTDELISSIINEMSAKENRFIEANEIIEQKIKINLCDTRLISNTIKKSVEAIKNVGLSVIYSIEESDSGYRIVIDIDN